MKYDVLALGDYYLDLIFTGSGWYAGIGPGSIQQGFLYAAGGTYNAVATLHRLESEGRLGGEFRKRRLQPVCKDISLEKRDWIRFVFDMEIDPIEK